MADEFTGVPRDEWWRTRDTAADARILAWMAWIGLWIIVIVLLRKGVLTLADFGIAGT